MPKSSIATTACVVGGGPAGMMLGYLLARAGVPVAVLEKHADFLRDFRGDTIHPSTMELMYELGLLDEFLKLPHSRVEHLGGQVGDTNIMLADFSHLPTHCKFIALMPQWDFLDFLAAHGKKYPTFDLHMKTEATDLIEEGGRVVGVRAKSPDGELEIRADLVIGTDGRHSTVRERAGFKVEDIGAPMDVLWFRISRRAGDTSETFGHMETGRMMVMLNRTDYWQCAYVIPKDGMVKVKAAGLDAFRENVALHVAVPARPAGRDQKLGRRKAADGGGRPAAALAQAGIALHRRCRARHVADRRRRHQSRHSGRGGRGQYPGRAAKRRARDERIA